MRRANLARRIVVAVALMSVAAFGPIPMAAAAVGTAGA